MEVSQISCVYYINYAILIKISNQENTHLQKGSTGGMGTSPSDNLVSWILSDVYYSLCVCNLYLKKSKHILYLISVIYPLYSQTTAICSLRSSHKRKASEIEQMRQGEEIGQQGQIELEQLLKENEVKTLNLKDMEISWGMYITCLNIISASIRLLINSITVLLQLQIIMEPMREDGVRVPHNNNNVGEKV